MPQKFSCPDKSNSAFPLGDIKHNFAIWQIYCIASDKATYYNEIEYLKKERVWTGFDGWVTT